MRVLVTGGRDYIDELHVFRVLDALNAAGVDLVIHGAARGADKLAENWAKARSVPFQAYPPDYQKYGSDAPKVRNQRMIDEGKPDVVVAFPGGSGTADMVGRAVRAGIPVARERVVG